MIQWNFRHTDSHGRVIFDRTKNVTQGDARELFAATVAAFRQGAPVLLEECSKEGVVVFTRPHPDADYELRLTFCSAGDSSDFRSFFEFAKVEGEVLPRPLGR